MGDAFYKAHVYSVMVCSYILYKIYMYVVLVFQVLISLIFYIQYKTSLIFYTHFIFIQFSFLTVDCFNF